MTYVVVFVYLLDVALCAWEVCSFVWQMWLGWKTLIHEVVGPSPALGIGAPQRMDTVLYCTLEATTIGQEDSNKTTMHWTKSH